MQKSKPAIHRSENDLNMREPAVCELHLPLLWRLCVPGF